jgi:hypothetical protein
MNHRAGFSILLVTAFLGGAVGCSPTRSASPFTPTPLSNETTAALPEMLQTSTPQPALVPSGVFTEGSDFCVSELKGSSFTANCDQNVLSVTQAKDRKTVAGLLTRSIGVDVSRFNLEVDTNSSMATDAKVDQNSYGFYFLDDDGYYKAMRVQGYYFDFETWSKRAEPKVQEQLNLSFSPYIKAAGEVNHWRLICTADACDIYANDNLIGRSLNGIHGKAKSIGIFTASDKDELFGQVTFNNLNIRTRLTPSLLLPPTYWKINFTVKTVPSPRPG